MYLIWLFMMYLAVYDVLFEKILSKIHYLAVFVATNISTWFFNRFLFDRFSNAVLQHIAPYIVLYYSTLSFCPPCHGKQLTVKSCFNKWFLLEKHKVFHLNFSKICTSFSFGRSQKIEHKKFAKIAHSLHCLFMKN